MSKKIVIVGALGYLGTELCKLYSGESWFNKVIAIDSRFVSERVSQLKDWNIEFYQGHILDKDFLKNNGLNPKGDLFKASKDGACLFEKQELETKWEKKTNTEDDRMAQTKYGRRNG